MTSGVTANTKSHNAVQIWSMATVWGVAIYVVIDIMLAYLRPDYSLLHNAESDYGRGPYFWLMDINFILRCLLSLALAKALLTNFPKSKTIRQASHWIMLWAIMSGLLAFFADDPYGYPRLRSDLYHLLFAFIAFVAALVAMMISKRMASAMNLSRNSTHYLIGLTCIAIVSFALMLQAGFKLHGLGGLYERLLLSSFLLWEVTLAISVRYNYLT